MKHFILFVYLLILLKYHLVLYSNEKQPNMTSNNSDLAA